MRILSICGSTRAGSSNEHILRFIASHWKNHDIEVYKDLALLPHFNPDVNEQDVAPEVRSLRQKISAAEAVIICTPEYVFSAPGALKNALEWMVSETVFSDKPTALIVASGLGEKTFESLTLIMDTLGVKWDADCRLLIQGARAKITEDGRFSDAGTGVKVNLVVEKLMLKVNHG